MPRARASASSVTPAATLQALQARQAELEARVAELTSANALHRQVLASARDGVVVFDRELRYRLFNPSMEEITGLTTAAVLGKRVDEVVPAVLADELDYRLQRALAGESVVSGDTFLPAIGKRPPLWFTARTSPLRDAAADIVGVVVVLTDITQRKEAEQNLVRERTLLSTLIDQIPDPIYAKDLSSRFLLANQALADLVGVAGPADLLGRTDEAFFPADLAAKFRADEIAVQGGRPLLNQEEVIALPDGTRRVLITTKLALRDAAGRVTSVVGIGRDITDRKRSEEALRDAEARYREIFEHSLEGRYQTTADGRFLSANTVLAKMLGYATPEELIRERTDIARQGYIEPARWEEFKRQLDAHGTVKEFVYELRRRGGSTIWVSENARTVRDAAGALLYYEGSMVDVTARLQAEEDLLVRERRFNAFFTGASAGLAMFDAERRYLQVNDTLAQINGRPVAEHIGQRIEDMLPSLAPVLVPLMEQVKSTGRPILNVELSGHTRSPAPGLRHWIASFFPSLGPDESVEGIGVIVVEVTEQKQAEQRIREQARLLDLARDAIAERDLADRCLYWNRGAELLYGWTAADVIGRPIHENIRGEGQAYDQAKAAVLRTGEWAGELKHFHKDGRVLTAASRWTLVRGEHGEPKSILVMNTDVTERKALEAQFFRAQRLEAIGTLASGIAHDLNNILAPILMSAPILRWNLPPKEVEKILVTIETSAQRGADLVRQLLTFGRGIEGERAVIKLDPLVREMARIAKQTFPKNITTTVELPGNLWPVRGDPTQLHQVLLNLCVNARDAMPNGGTLTIAAENSRLDASFVGMMPEAQPGNYVVLRVADTGTGIPPHIVDKIFDPFFTTKESGKGTGLGLATVIGIVKSHSGFTNLRSEVGSGTVFFVYLPASTDTPTAEKDTATPAIPRGNGEVLLLVDDEESIRNVVREALSRHNYQVVTATDGADAIAQYAQLKGNVSAVLTDIDMPVMDGVTMIHVLKRMNPGLKILVSSGLASSAHIETRRRELSAYGIGEILVKPYTAETILLALHELLKG